MSMPSTFVWPLRDPNDLGRWDYTVQRLLRVFEIDNDQLPDQPHTVSGRPEAYGRTKAYVLGIVSASLSLVQRLVAYAGWDFSDTTQSPGRLHKFVLDMECFKSMGKFSDELAVVVQRLRPKHFADMREFVSWWNTLRIQFHNAGKLRVGNPIDNKILTYMAISTLEKDYPRWYDVFKGPQEKGKLNFDRLMLELLSRDAHGFPPRYPGQDPVEPSDEYTECSDDKAMSDTLENGADEIPDEVAKQEAETDDNDKRGKGDAEPMSE